MPDLLAYVGCRTTRERNARGDGLNVFRIATNGRWTHVQRVGDLVNPSWLTLARTRPVLYVAHGDTEEVSAFRIAPDGTLAPLNRAPCGGRNPVHLATTRADRFLVVANHLTSTIGVLRLDPATGAIGEIATLHPLPGTPGPHRIEQPFAKPHQVLADPSGDLILVPDKGLDRIFAFRVTPDGRLEESAPAAVAREGAGPRHLAITPDARFAYVLNELDSTILACRHEPATAALTPFQILPSLPDAYTGHSRAAGIAISPDGRFLYASNRGHDSVGAFAADASTGRLRPLGWTQTGGRTPRFIALDPGGATLYAANEDDDTIAAFTVDRATGTLTPRGTVAETGSPVCILFHAS